MEGRRSSQSLRSIPGRACQIIAKTCRDAAFARRDTGAPIAMEADSELPLVLTVLFPVVFGLIVSGEVWDDPIFMWGVAVALVAAGTKVVLISMGLEAAVP